MSQFTSSDNNEKSVTDEEEEDDEESGEDEMDLVEDELVDEMETMNFDFEAFPPSEQDLDQIEALLTQIFLRADLDARGLSKAIVAQAPLGCVYKPAEEYEDEESDETSLYGLLSIVQLDKNEKFANDVSDLILQRAKKFATADICKDFEKKLQPQNEEKIGFLVNERLLNFPSQISGPAFASLRDDYMSTPPTARFQHILMIVKIRIDQGGSSTVSSSSDQPSNSKAKRKMGKAERKRQMAAEMATADAIFDNPEEQILFSPQFVPFPFFQYPVESEIDKASKFHCIRRNGRIFRPYRRVCLLSEEQFLQFANKVSIDDS